MRISPFCRLPAALLAVFLTFQATSTRAESNADANALFVEAVLAWDEANAITDTGAEAQSERLRLLQIADNNLNAIISEHPGTDLAVKLVTGTNLGNVSLHAVRTALEQAEPVTAQANDWAACLAAPAPDCILAEAIQQAENIAASGAEPVGYSSIISAQAQMGQIDAALSNLARLSSPSNRDFARLDIIRAQLAAEDLVGAATTLDAMEGDNAPGYALRDLGKAQAAAGLADQARATLARAISLAQQDDDEGSRLRSLVQVGRVQARNGSFDDAFSTASLIENPDSLDELLGEIAAAQAESGLYDQARATLGGIGSPDRLASAQGTVAMALARAGLLDQALVAAREITDGSRRAMSLAIIARQQVAAGIDPSATLAEAHDAIEIETADDNWDTAFALNAISTAETLAGLSGNARDSFSHALQIAGEIRSTESRSYLLTGLAQLQAKDGSPDLAAEAFAAARLLLTESDDPRYMLTRFQAMAAAQEIAGDPGAGQTWANAAEMAMTISDDAYRIASLAEIARSLAQAKRQRAEVLADVP